MLNRFSRVITSKQQLKNILTTQTVKQITNNNATNNVRAYSVAIQSYNTRNNSNNKLNNSKYNSIQIRNFAIETVKVPSLGDSISEGTLVKWQKQVGEKVERDEVLVVIETDKVSVDIRSPTAGVVKSHSAKEGDTIKVGAELGSVDTAGTPSASSAPKQQPSSGAGSTNVKQAQPAQSTAAAPTDKDTSTGSGPRAASGPQPQPSSSTVPANNTQPAKSAPSTSNVGASAPKPAPQAVTISFPTGGTRAEKRVPMTRMRQTIANRLKHAQNTAASLTTFNEIDMTNIMELRNKHKDEFAERHGIKLGFMSAFVRAATVALQKYPDVNAYIEGTDIVYHDYVDISVAVSTPTGLVVPVLRNCEQLSFHQIEAAINNLGAKARKNQIAIEDMTGGTFTISNGGVYGSLWGTPILNPPQSAILGMHGIFKRPVVVNDKIEIRPMMYIALTYDHRIIDGGAAVTFLKEIKANVEDPSRLLLNL